MAIAEVSQLSRLYDRVTSALIQRSTNTMLVQPRVGAWRADPETSIGKGLLLALPLSLLIWRALVVLLR